MTNTETAPRPLTDKQADALEALAMKEHRDRKPNLITLPGVGVSTKTPGAIAPSVARALEARGYAVVVYRTTVAHDGRAHTRYGITLAGLRAYAEIGGDVPAEWIAPPESANAQRGRMVAESYSADPTNRLSCLLADLWEHAEHEGFDFDTLVAAARARVAAR